MMRFIAAMIAILLSVSAFLDAVAAAQPKPAPGAEQKASPVRTKTASPTPKDKTSPSKVPAADTESATPKTAKNVWSATEIAAAQKVCKALLREYKAVATPVPPIKKGRCGDPAPIKLMQIGKKPVSFSPPPTINCQMVAALGKWISKGLQPLAKQHIGARLTQISVMSSYACRNRYGRKRAKLSEHAKANALDIGGFVFKSDTNVRVLAGWGLTERDRIARAAAARKTRDALATPSPDPKGLKVRGGTPPSKDAKDAGGATAALPEPRVARAEQRSAVGRGEASVFAGSFQQFVLPPLPERRPSLKERMRWAQLERKAAARRAARERQRLERYRAKLNKFLYPANRLGGAKPTKIATGKAEVDKNEDGSGSKPDHMGFLKAAHRSACRYFTTVLGPEANEAHRNHFHVDLVKRKWKNYCQ
jgi:hypothetical protein